MPEYGFSSAYLYGSTVQNGVQVPRKFGGLTGVDLDISFNLKEFFGQNTFPLTIARGQGKITGKATFGQLNGALMNDLFWSQTNAVGLTTVNLRTLVTPAANDATIVPPSSANWVDVLNVSYAANGNPLTRSNAASATGLFTAAANGANGALVFNGNDTGQMVVDYSSTLSTAGNTTTLTNTFTGAAPTFQVEIAFPYNGMQLYFQLLSCVSSKLSFASKTEDFTIPEFDFQAQDNGAGLIGSVSLNQL